MGSRGAESKLSRLFVNPDPFGEDIIVIYCAPATGHTMPEPTVNTTGRQKQGGSFEQLREQLRHNGPEPVCGRLSIDADDHHGMQRHPKPREFLGFQHRFSGDYMAAGRNSIYGAYGLNREQFGGKGRDRNRGHGGEGSSVKRRPMPASVARRSSWAAARRAFTVVASGPLAESVTLIPPPGPVRIARDLM